jgi:hypothetical protein
MILIFFAIMLSTNVFMTAVFGKNKAEYLPLSEMAMIVVLYVCAVADWIFGGVILIYACVGLMYILSIIYIIKGKKFREFIKEFLKPYVVWMAVVYAVILFCNYGRVVSIYDDLDHWALCVKELIRLNGLSPDTADYAPAYPPAMALLQYFAVRTNQVLYGNNEFPEWWLFVTYQFATYSMLAPIMDILSHKKEKLINIILAGVVVYLMPTFGFTTFLARLYIDTFISVLIVFGIVCITNNELSTLMKNICLILVCVILTLSKDIGLIFGTCIALIYLVYIFATERYVNNQKIKLRNLMYILPLAAVILAKYTWSIKAISLGYNSVSNSVSSMAKAISSVQVVSDDSVLEVNYHRQIFANYVNAILNINLFDIGNTSIEISCFTALIIFSIVLFYVLYRLSNNNKKREKVNMIFGTSFLIMILIYIVAQGIFYIYLFPTNLAVKVAEFYRYMGIAFSAYFMIDVTLLIRHTHEKVMDNRKVALILIVIISLFSIDMEMLHYFSRSSVNSSIETRETYIEDVDNINSYVNPGQYMYMVNMDEDESDHTLTWHEINYLCNDINKEKNLNGNVTQSDAEEWLDYLLDNYDFVYLRAVDEDFVETYGKAFEELPDASETKVMYAVDKTEGKLVKCN